MTTEFLTIKVATFLKFSDMAFPRKTVFFDNFRLLPPMAIPTGQALECPKGSYFTLSGLDTFAS